MSTPYDTFPYRALPVPEAHVDRLHVVAHLFGMAPAPLERCRVLELGCADGGHLVPMAEALPASEFVGVDLSARQIADGQAWTAPLGRSNLRLLHGDATDLPDGLGTFDYVICHGLYSWIPAAHRPGLLRSLRTHLRPQGVAYLSYNTLPGGSTRRQIRDFVLQHAAETGPPSERVDAARAMLQFLHDGANPDTPHGQHLRDQCASLLGTSPQYLLHGLLADVNDAFYLRDVVAAAGGAGLAYLGDVQLERMLGTDLHAGGRQKLNSVPGDQVDREQVLDFLAHQAFRQSLLVPAGTALERTVPWSRVTPLWLSARARCTRGHPTDDGEARFDTSAGAITSDDPVWKVGLAVLGALWPSQLSFRAWTSAVAGALGRDEATVTQALGRRVLPMFAAGVLDLSPRDRRIAAVVPQQPEATPWARQQVALGHPVTDLAHGIRRLPTPLAALLTLCDGTRSHAELLATARAQPAVATVGDVAAWLPGALESLRIRALLLAPESR